jgi:hypothetical protein
MRKSKLFAVALLLAAVLCVAGTSYAQAPQVVAVGSSGAFTSMVAAMTLPDSTIGFSAPVCGSRVWTYSDATKIWAIDPRGGIPNEPGNIAVVWDNDASPNNVCVYFSVDSIVGLRLLLAQSGAGGTAGNGSLHVDPSVSGTSGGTAGLAGQNKVGYVTDTVNNTCGASSNQACGLPPAVFALVNGAHFNVAFSDIRPDDGQYAYGRAACGPVDEVSCFGYGPLNGVGTAILSTFNSNNQANTVAFAVSGGTDQFPPHLIVPNTKIINVGAYPIMFFYNALDTSAGGLGALLPKNILSHTVAGFFSGQLGVNQDLMGVPTTPLKVLDVVQREAMSGTFNTFEFQGVHDRDGNSGFSQETGVFVPTNYGTGASCSFVVPSSPTYADPGSNCSNPMRVPGLANHRFRAIGTGEMVSAVNSAANGSNRLGYAFFSLGTFATAKAGNTRYMTLDGVDPLYPSYSTSNGVFPNCSGAFNLGTFSCASSPVPAPTFDGLKAGNYRVWNIIRGLRYANCTGAPAPTCYTAPAAGQPNVDGLIAAGQDQAFSAAASDFVPYQRCTAGGSGVCTTSASVLTVFRSHYSLPATVGNASNGNGAEPTENGGDMAGAVFSISSDVDAFNISGQQFLTWIQ